MRFIKPQKSTGTFLDVGCAYGYAVELAVQNGYEAHGFDASEHAVLQAKSLLETNELNRDLLLRFHTKRNHSM